MVPTVRLELTRLSPPPPQDGVSTNSTTSAIPNDSNAFQLVVCKRSTRNALASAVSNTNRLLREQATSGCPTDDWRALCSPYRWAQGSHRSGAPASPESRRGRQALFRRAPVPAPACRPCS